MKARRSLVLAVLEAIFITIASVTLAQSSPENATEDTSPDVNAKTPHLVIEGAIRRLRAAARALDGENAPTLPLPPLNSSSSPTSTNAPGSDADTETAPWLAELQKRQDEQNAAVTPAERRILMEKLKAVPELDKLLDQFVSLPFDIENPEGNAEFVKVRDKIVDMLFVKSKKDSLVRHYIVTNYRLFHPEALARFRHFDTAWQKRFELFQWNQRKHERWVATTITVLGTVLVVGASIKIFRAPLLKDMKYPMIARVSRWGLLAALGGGWWKSHENISEVGADTVLNLFRSDMKPIPTDPLELNGDLSDEVLMLEHLHD